MIRRISAIPLLALTIVLAACGGAKQDKEAVRQGIVEHLKGSGLNMADMDMQITSLNFHGKAADATTSFQTKQQGGGPPLQFAYKLEDQNGKWVVVGKGTPVGAGMHDATMPVGPGGKDASPAQALPPGHPSIPPSGGTSSQQQ